MKKIYFQNPFQKSIKGNKPKKSKTKFKIVISFIIIMSIIFWGCSYVEHHVMPIVIDMSSLKINTMATNLINDAVEETFIEEDVHTEDLLTYYFNDEGKIISCGVNTILINTLCSKIIGKITEEIDVTKHETLTIPLGHVISEGAFSNYGPDIDIEIMPYGTANINYDKEFISTGINQINYRIWLDVELTMQLILPLNRKTVIVNQEITLVDSIFIGEIPENYVDVPKENILDVTW